MRVKSSVFSFGALALASASSSQALNKVVEEDVRYLLGVGVSQSADYAGAANNTTRLKPLWAMRWGKWRLATSGSAALMGFGVDATSLGSGASRDLFNGDDLRLGFGLRIDGGRNSSDSGITAGLSDVQRTLRGRFYASYKLTPDWQLSGAFSQDLLGREGGGVWTADLSRPLFRSKTGELIGGVSVSAGTRQNISSYFGVPAGSAAAERLGSSYEPGAGLREMGLGLAYKRSLSRHWVGFTGLGFSRLLGPVAASPLTQQQNNYSWNMGLAYRN
jgi:outer membrane protein